MKVIHVLVAVLAGLVGISAAALAAEVPGSAPRSAPALKMDGAKFHQLLVSWEDYAEEDEEQIWPCEEQGFYGEDMGWVTSPRMESFYAGFMVTRDPRWIDHEIHWADALLVKHTTTEPDGYVGWPKRGAAKITVDNLNGFDADSMLSDAMVMRPLVLLSREILRNPVLKANYGEKAEAYVKLSAQLYEKWQKRGGWRETKDHGLIPVVLPYGLNATRTAWVDGFERRNDPGNGVSVETMKANYIARWSLAMFDATGKESYKDDAERWFRTFKSRLVLQDDGSYKLWDSWQPAGMWDFTSEGKPKAQIAPSKNPGIYDADMVSIVDAYEHGVVFTSADMDRFVATARKEKCNWAALAPYDATLQKQFEETLQPKRWSGLARTPVYLMYQAKLRQALPETPLATQVQ